MHNATLPRSPRGTCVATLVSLGGGAGCHTFSSPYIAIQDLLDLSHYFCIGTRSCRSCPQAHSAGFGDEESVIWYVNGSKSQVRRNPALQRWVGSIQCKDGNNMLSRSTVRALECDGSSSEETVLDEMSRQDGGVHGIGAWG